VSCSRLSRRPFSRATAPRRRSPRFRTNAPSTHGRLPPRAVRELPQRARRDLPRRKRLVGAPFFDAAVDAFVDAHPATSGDLNLYGDTFGAFLSVYPPAASLPYLGDVAALEWAQDEANRAADYASSPQEVLADLTSMAPADLPEARLALAPSCRLLASRHPILRIWQVNQDTYLGDERVDLDAGADRLLVRREARGVTIERLPAGEYGFLASLATASSLGAAIEAAQNADAAFDLATALRARIADGTIVGVM
jgi:hypothetical protein